MTIREYLNTKLQSLMLNEAQLVDFSLNSGVNLDAEYTAEVSDIVNKNMITLIEDVIFMPRPKSINEGGFSMAWDYADLGKFYMWLCRRYGKTPNTDAASMMGISMIIDRTNEW